MAFFGPLKREWRKILSAYKNDFPSESAVRKDKFPQLLKILIDRATATSDVNLQNGFKKCLSRDAVLAEKKFEVAEVQINSVVNQALLDVLQTKRFGNKLRTVKRNKLSIQPGKSVGDMDDGEKDEKNNESEEDFKETGAQQEDEEETEAQQQDEKRNLSRMGNLARIQKMKKYSKNLPQGDECW